MHHFMNSLKPCSPRISSSARIRNKSLIRTVFSMFNVVLARVDYFQDISIYVIETKLDFVSFDDIKTFKDDENL